MAPIQIPLNDTLKTLHNVLKQRAETRQALEKRKAPSGEDYRRMEDEYNKTKCANSPENENTKASIYYTRQKWAR